MKKCPVCGKEFDVLWPDLWRYKRNGGTANYWKYFCSWGCLRKYDKGREQNTMLTDEQKRKAAYMAYNGENPLPYLKQCGMSNPTSAWQTVRKWARETVELVYDPDVEEEIEKARGMAKITLEPKEKEKDGGEKPEIWRTTAISCERLGEFYFDRKYGTIDWRNPYGDEVSIPPEDWAQLADRIPQILHVLNPEEYR